MLERNYFTLRQSGALEVSIEKVKGIKSSKLRTVQTIELYLKSLVRTLLKDRAGENNENDARVSKWNYDSRKGHTT